MNEQLRTMHLFAGAGGGILADLILGHRPIVAVEWDRYACDVLRARVADGWFDGMSVWEGDVQLFDPSEYKGRVDCIHAGFPCQDISQAGNQRGVGENTRSGLYREVLRIADTIQPRYLFLENVSAIVSGDNGGMLRTVTGDLAKRGYDAVWRCLSAAQVGANHKRDRWWCLAYSNGTRCERYWDSTERGEEEHPLSGLPSEELAYTKDERDVRREWSVEPVEKKYVYRGSESDGGWQWWQTESRVGRVVDGMAHRAYRLKALGNGQVPLQAATAFSILYEQYKTIRGANDAKN